MIYEKQTFVNDSTVLTADHLEHIEDGIFRNSKVINDITGSTYNIFDMSVFDGVEGIAKDTNGYYTGTGQAFANAFASGVPELSFEADSQYYLSVLAYTDGNDSTEAVNGLQFSFYNSEDTRIGRKSVLNSTTTSTLVELVSTSGNSVSYMTIGVSGSPLNVWHIKDILLYKGSVAKNYIPHTTAVDHTSRMNDALSVYKNDVSYNKIGGSYISLQNKKIGDTVDLTPVSNSAFGYLLDDCKKGDCYIITTSGASAAKPWAFIDSNNAVTLITHDINNTGDENITNYAVIAPANGKLIVNSNKNKDFNVIKIENATTVQSVAEAQFVRDANRANRWRGKKVVTFGDSRTWYDKHSYTENTKTEWVGKVCVGYQEQMRNLMMTTVDNQGESGYTSAQICEKIRAFDFTGYDAVFLEGGVNDFVKSSQITIGAIAPIGAEFDTTTVYGAWQSAIEYISTNYPSVQIYMDIPAIAWIGTTDDVFPYDIAKIKGEVAELYNIPCLNLYKISGINAINRDYYYCDDVEGTNWRLHFNDYGNALIGAKIAEFMINSNERYASEHTAYDSKIMPEIMDVAFQKGSVTSSGFNYDATNEIISEFLTLDGYDYVDIQFVDEDDRFKFAVYTYDSETEKTAMYLNKNFVYHGTIRCDNPTVSFILRVGYNSKYTDLTVENVKKSFVITRGKYDKQYPQDAIGSVCKGENIYFPVIEPFFEHTCGTTGYNADRDNAVTRPLPLDDYDGIRFTFTDPLFQYAIYSVDSAGAYNRLHTSANIKAPAEYSFTDKSVRYIVVVDKLNSSANYTQDDMDAIPGTHTIEYFYANANKEENTAVYGYSRQYTDITHMLNWEPKCFPESGSGALVDGNKKTMVARLPAGACWEVKKNSPEGRFRIAEFDYMGYYPSDYNHYAQRNCDTNTEWFVEVSFENNNSMYIATDNVYGNYEVDRNIEQYAQNVGKAIKVYTFTDVGVLHTKSNPSLYGKTIAVIGDSIVQGRFCKYGTSVNLAMAKPWSHHIAEVCNVEPANFGIGGAKVVDGEWRSLYRTCSKVIGYDVCFVCAGTNDYGGNVSAEDFRAAYDYVLTILVEANSNVVVCTPVYRTNKTAANSAGLTLADYCNIMKELAAENNCRVLDLYTLTNTATFKATLTDGLHPNEVGQKMIADIVLDNY